MVALGISPEGSWPPGGLQPVATRGPTLDRVSLLERVQSDITAAMKAGERDRVGALRLVSSELQKAHKEAAGTEIDEVAVLQRERKRRVEAAEAYREAGRDDLASGEESEAALIDAYLPAQLSDDELHAIVGDVVAETGAASPKEMGRVMSMVMPRVQGRADGKRVSAVVKEKLTA
jgi:uncharacterized protein YqeY